jgi:excisionase family DNA binding protein
MPQSLTIAQLAERWRLPQSTVKRLAEEGEIPCLYVHGELLFLESAIEEWENTREHKIRNEARHLRASH